MVSADTLRKGASPLSGLCRPWREQAGDEIDQAARVPPVRVFVGDEVSDREANESPRPFFNYQILSRGPQTGS